MIALLVLSLLLIAPASLDAQGARADSAVLVRAARAAQRDFEVDRVRSLMQGGPTGGGGCDEVIGRMCYTFEHERDWWPAPDPPELTVARDRLLRVLADAHAAAPRDVWILGQRVLYLGEAGRWGSADSLARSVCAAEPDGWCLQLDGLALHRLGRFEDSERAFRAALARMPPDSARAWMDPSVLLELSARERLKRGAPEARERDWAAVWRLADPLWLVAGNDGLTEHWARRATARLHEDARNAYGMSWGGDLAEVLVRYGPEIGWERSPRGGFDPAGGDDVTSHEDPDARPLLPPARVLADPARAAAGDWTPDFKRPRSTYAPAYGIVLPAESQLAVFPRGDRFVLVGAYGLPEDTTFHARHGHAGREEPRPPWDSVPTRAALFLQPADDPTAQPLEARAVGATTGALLIEAPAGRWVASLEVLDPSVRRAGRVRWGLVVTAHPAADDLLSDLMLVGGPVAEGAALPDAARLALHRDWVRAGEPVGLVWEVLGVPGQSLSYVLTLQPARAGAVRRALGSLGLMRSPPARRLEWQEPAPDGRAIRSVQLDLAALEPGRWVVRLEVRSGSGLPQIRERTVELRKPTEG